MKVCTDTNVYDTHMKVHEVEVGYVHGNSDS